MTDSCYPELLRLLNDSDEDTLWIVDENLPLDALGALRPRHSLSAISNRWDVAQALQNAGVECGLNDFQAPADRTFQHVVYRLSKERPVVRHCIGEAARVLCLQGHLSLFGRKNDGLKTELKYAEGMLGPVSFYKKRGLCYEAEVIKEEDAVANEDSYSQLRDLHIGDLNFVSKPGVFGWNKIDRGSALLVETLRDNIAQFDTEGSLLDLGCGWGYLTLTTAELKFRERFASDNNVTALIAAEENFRRAGLRVECSADDCASQLTGNFDLILCNPPFHQGFSTDEELSRKFLRATARLLARKGKALFVVNQFIPLEGLAAEHFGRIDVLARRDGFKLIALGF